MIDFEQMNKAVDAMVDAEIAGNGAVPIGDIIVALENAPEDLPVRFCPSGDHFGDVGSYRGFYRLPSCSPSDGPVFPSEAARRLALAVDGQISFYGYKGGEYYFNRMMPLFEAEWGETSGMAVTRVQIGDDAVWLHTSKVYE